MNERRTFAEAFAKDPLENSKVDKFVHQGVPSNADAAPPNPNSMDEVASTHQSSDVTGESVVDRVVAAKPRKVKSRRRESTRKSNAEESVPKELRAALAKATVQKTVRFDPRLIVQWEAYSQRQEESGEKPLSFQQVQNDALKLWLEATVPNRG